MKFIISIMFTLSLVISCAGNKSGMSEETEQRLQDIEEETAIKLAELEAAKILEVALAALQPSWVTKRPYVADANIIEGVGVSAAKTAKEAMRKISRDGAVAEISISTEVTDTSYVENYFKDFEEHYASVGKTRTSREELQALMRNNILKYITLAEEWQNPINGEYWYYAYMLKGEIELNILESAKEQATIKEEVITEVGRDEFTDRIEQRIARTQNDIAQQRELVQSELKQLLEERAKERGE